MRIVLALDKFKGTLTALQACGCVRDGLTAALESVDCTLCPIADGGEGTVEALEARLSGERHGVMVENAVGSREVVAEYLIDRSGDEVVAYLEMAAASGLALLTEEERDPLRATTFGTGQMIRAAVTEQMAARVVIGLGGSATNDGGMGLARALGYRFLDVSGEDLVHPAELVRLESIQSPQSSGSWECTVLADVTNPLLGPDGAIAIYGPQKGVTGASAPILEVALERLAEVVERDLGKDLRDLPGAGAAGGCAFGLMAFCGANLVPGFDYISDCLDLEAAIAGADMVVTGEGRMDRQTLSGKGPAGVAALAEKHGKPVAALCGAVEESARGDLEAVFPFLRSLSEEAGAEEAMERPAETLSQVSRQLGAWWQRVHGSR